MTISKAVRRVTGLLLVGALIFSQLVVAVYACPGPAGSAAPPTGASLAEEPDLLAVDACPMDTESDAASLCGEHCKYGHSASNAAKAPTVLPALAGAGYLLAPRLQNPSLSLAAFTSRPRPPAAAPHTILHCSFLI